MSGQDSQSGVASSAQTPSAPASPQPSSAPVVAAGGGGDTGTVEEPGGEPRIEEVGLDEAAVVMGDGSAGVTVTIPGIRSTTAQATGPGEVSGPALVVTVSVENTMSEPVDLSLVAVNMTDSAGNPGEGMIGEPAQWLEGTLEPGGSTEGIYVFAIDRDARAPITVTVSLGASIVTAQFVGDAD
jgi:Telomeric repeat-binding factor 2.